MANTDARTSCFYARSTLELAVDWLYKHDPASVCRTRTISAP
jgi:type I restriction enzyme R subunit